MCALCLQYDELHDIIGMDRVSNLTVQEKLTQQGVVLNVLSNTTTSNLYFVHQIDGQVSKRLVEDNT